MIPPSNAGSYRALHDAIITFASTHPSPELTIFRANLKNLSAERSEVPSTRLPAADYLEPAATTATPETRGLLELINEQRDHVLWEQSYKAADGAVGDDMLSRYGFVEVIGARGPYVSTSVRAGIGVFGPQVNYPTHHHQAEEVYFVLAGAGVFDVGDAPSRHCRAGDAVHVVSNTPHALHTEREALIVLYLWQNGPLRAQSTFV